MVGVLLAAVLGAGAWPGLEVREGYLRTRAEGFEVRVSGDLLREPELSGRVLASLRSDLAMIAGVVPGPAMEVLRERTAFWVEKQGAVVPGGMSGRGMVYHPSAIWLKTNGLDPAKAGGVEIVRAEDFLDWRSEQPMMTLHELAHAYHHLVGVDDPRIVGAFEAAVASGRYEAVGYVLAPEGETRRAYAMNSATEYFAELSEAYFGRNDYGPFDRDELRKFDPAGFEMVETVWSMDGDALRAAMGRD